MLGADLALLGALGSVGSGSWPCWARRAVLGADLALLGALGWVGSGIWPCWARWAGLGVGFGFGGRAGPGWAQIGLCVYGLHCTRLLHVFMMSLCLSWIERRKKSQQARLL